MQPAEDNVQIRSILDEAISAADNLGLSKPAKEQKEVANVNPGACQMALGRADLTEEGTPTRSAGIGAGHQIRIEMCSMPACDLSTSEVLDNSTKRVSVDVKLAVRDVRFKGNGKR